MKRFTTLLTVSIMFAIAQTAFNEPLPPQEKAMLRKRLAEACAAIPDDAVRGQETTLPANEDVVLDAVAGTAIALDIEIDPQETRCVQLSVLRSPGGEEKTVIRFYNFDRRISTWFSRASALVLDTTYSSQSPDVRVHPPQEAVLARRGALRLRVLVDRNIVGVLADDKLFMAARVSPQRADSVGVSLKAYGRDAVLRSIGGQPIAAIGELDVLVKPQRKPGSKPRE